ncbi:adenylate cyclase [Pasteurellaceae bacterium Pebbles2]|nr:adenylate cyclase [Pasteurellaceae bacterium Pebbles2]
MSNEIELKIAISPTVADNFAQILSDFRILEQKKIFLGNTYYDTAEAYFAQRKMGLRVRSENQQFVMTLKTDGKVTGGLHIRPEYNFPLNSSQPDVSLLQGLSEYQFPAELPLQPIFSTDFQRTLWLIECGQHSEIEVALDRGEIQAGEQKQPICEVEFELKCGNMQDLLTFVANLSFVDGVRLSAASKAKRGYQLASGKQPALQDWIEKWREFLDSEKSAVNSREVLTALFSLEQQLIEETMHFGTAFFAQDFMRTVERVGAFFNLYHHYLEHGKLLQAALNEQLELGVALDESLMVELIESNQELFAQIRDIIRLHSESKDNLLAMQKLTDLLQQGQYIKRMINFIQLTAN